MIDALGNEIVLGNIYGYSRSQNGINTVHIGEALNETKKGLLTMKILSSKTGVYDSIKDCDTPHKNISVKSCLLFPVYMKVYDND